MLAALFTATALLAIPAAAQRPATLAAAPPDAPQPYPPSAGGPVSGQDQSSTADIGLFEDPGQQPRALEPLTQQSEAPAPSGKATQRARLGVNPVTGLTVSPALNFTPLTADERWKLYWKQSFFSVGAYFKPVFFALVLDQTANSPSSWGGGFRGFGLRVSSRVLSNVVQGTIRAPLAAALHEDVRYITDHRGGKRRVLHAVEYSFLTYNDQGHTTLNVSKLVGYYGSTAISTTWRPERHSVAGYTFINGSEQLALSVPINYSARVLARSRPHIHTP